jgi:hypothetical protein
MPNGGYSRRLSLMAITFREIACYQEKQDRVRAADISGHAAGRQLAAAICGQCRSWVPR